MSGIAFLVLAFLVGRLAEGLAPGYGGPGLVSFALGTLVAPFAAVNFAELPLAASASARSCSPGGTSCAGGWLGGIGVLVEYQGALLLVLVGVYVALEGCVPSAVTWRGRSRLLLLLGYDTLAFGRPWRTSTVTSRTYWQATGQGFFGVGAPHAFGLYSVFSSSGGLLVLSPVLVAAAWGCRLGHQYRVEAIVCTAVVALFVLLDAGYFIPYGGVSPGPRFLIPCLPFLALGLGPAFLWRPRLTSALAAFSIVPTVAMTLVWPENLPLRETIWGELARIPSGLGNARFVYSLSSNVIVWAGPTRTEGAALVAAAAIPPSRSQWSARASGSRATPEPSSLGGRRRSGFPRLIAAATPRRSSSFPTGPALTVRRPDFVSLVPSIVGTRTYALPGQEVDFTVYLDNPTRDTLTQVLPRSTIRGAETTGPPYERGSGCVGTSTLVCNLDFLEARRARSCASVSR